MTAYIRTSNKKPKGSVKGFHPCPTCGTVYENRTGKKRFCSSECFPREDKMCTVCSSPFLARKKSEKWCSIECRKHSSIQRVYVAKAESKDDLVECLICNSFHKQLASHLIAKHSKSSAEYLTMFPESKTICENTSRIYSKNASGENNAWFNHGGSLSPFSIKFKKYSEFSDEDKLLAKTDAINRYVKSTPIENRPISLQYWLNKGLSQEEAEKALKNKQSTFSLDKCIEKYGEEEGLAKWTARQEKWQDTLNSKPIEEIERINRAKMYSSGSHSKVSQELFNRLPAGRYGRRDETNAGEVMLRNSSTRKCMFLDYVFGFKCIEFNGDYWHANPNKYTADKAMGFIGNKSQTAKQIWDNDTSRHAFIRQAGYELLIIWESDYMKNKEGTVEKCLTFLNA